MKIRANCAARSWAPGSWASAPSSPTSKHARCKRALEREQIEGHVVIAGFGRIGRTAAEALDGIGEPFVVVEADHEEARTAGRRGYRVIWGDAARPEVIEAAGLERARMLVVATSDSRATTAPRPPPADGCG